MIAGDKRREFATRITPHDKLRQNGTQSGRDLHQVDSWGRCDSRTGGSTAAAAVAAEAITGGVTDGSLLDSELRSRYCA